MTHHGLYVTSYMNNILSVEQLHRRRAGEHLILLQQRQISQKLYQKHCDNISSRPGRHSGNINRQDISYAALSLLTMLTLVRNNNATITKNTELLKFDGYIYAANGFYRKNISDFVALPSKENLTPVQADTKTRKIMSMVHSVSKGTYDNNHRVNTVKSTMMMAEPSDTLMTTDLPTTEKKDQAIGRALRHVHQSIKRTTPVPVIDNVTVVRLYDFSCINSDDKDNFANILRKISLSLSKPVTQLTIESMNIDSWRKGHGCPDENDIKKVSKITEIIDEVISQIIGILPYGRSLAVTQAIIAPLLERASDDLQQRAVLPEKELSLLQEIIQQARVSLVSTGYISQYDLGPKSTHQGKKPQLTLPDFHIKNGINHIDIESKGHAHRVPVLYEKGNIYVTMPKGYKGATQRYQVYFNYLSHKWKMTGNGRFNRFSKKERQLVYRFSISPYYSTPLQGRHNTGIYSVDNPYTAHPGKLTAVEMFGQFVPFTHHPGTNQFVIYDAARGRASHHEIILARNEWHLKLPADKKVKFSMLYSPEYSRTLKVDMIRERKGKKMYAQINTEAGFLWGEIFFLNQHGHLELLNPKGISDRYYKNTIGNSLFSGGRKTTKNGKQHDNDDFIYYQRESGCFRIKRGSSHSHMCKGGDRKGNIDLSKYPIIAEGSIGVIYDYQHDRVIKRYKGKFDERHKSRLLSAKNNAKGFNRLYGAESASIYINTNKDGSGAVFVKLKKIKGNSLDSIGTISDKDSLHHLMDVIDNTNPADLLSAKLQRLGIIHNDINKGNIIYDVETGFNIIDFDSANYLPDGDVVSASKTDSMRNKFAYVFNEVRRDIVHHLDKLNQSS